MSWDQYIVNLQANATVMEAAIWGHEGSMWAQSSGLAAVTADEIKQMTADIKSAFTNGLRIAGMKCTLLKDEWNEPESLCLSLSTKIEGTTHSVCVGKSNKAYLIVLSKPGIKVGQMLPAVHKMAQYLKELGY